MEQQVAQAALAVVRADTDALTRTEASSFLENWTRTPQAWPVYASWLQSFSTARLVVTPHDADQVGMKLLCLQLLQAKIRREVNTRCHHPEEELVLACLTSIQTELMAFLQHPDPPSACSPACICLVSLAVRLGGTAQLVQSCTSAESTANINWVTRLRLLANVPLEVEATDLQTFQVASKLQPFVPAVLNCLQQAVVMGNEVAEALEALKQWVTVANIGLGTLFTPASNATEPILVTLMHVLSSGNIPEERILVKAAQVLTVALLTKTPPSTDATIHSNDQHSQSAAMTRIFEALVHERQPHSILFISTPMQLSTANEWDEACLALATFVCTFVEEQVEHVVTQPAEPLLRLLLQIQNHPIQKVRILTLESWLAVQDIPTAERCLHWKAPLFAQVVEVLLHHAAYPVDCDELDQDELKEFRRLVQDVLVHSYFLLRFSYVQRMAQWIVPSLAGDTHRPDWRVQEAALFALVSTAREVCARVKSNTGGSSLAKDRSATSEQLLHLVQNLMTVSPTSTHPLAIQQLVECIGVYAPAWDTLCVPDAILHLLHYLRQVMISFCTPPAAQCEEAQAVVVAAGKACRSLLIGCGGKLLTLDRGILRDSLRNIMEAALSSQSEKAIGQVVEACTRLLVLSKDETFLRQGLGDMSGSLFQKGDAVLQMLPLDGSALSEQASLAADELGRYLFGLQVIVRFCEPPSDGSGFNSPVYEIVASISPFLDRVGERALQHEYLVGKVLSVHEQMLKTLPETVGPHLPTTMKFVVSVFEKTQLSSAMAYMCSAVELAGSKDADFFRNLVDHVTPAVFSILKDKEALESRPDIVQGFFQLNQRYALYCPGVLVHSTHFSSIVSCAVECLTACQGERESTRASLNFLTHLFGWKISRQLSAEATAQWAASSHIVDQQTIMHGPSVLKSCMATLVNGPQMLWPSTTECVFALLSSIRVTAAGSTSENDPALPSENSSAEQTLRHWLALAAPAQDENKASVYPQVVDLLIGLLQHGAKGKRKIKMLLTDFSKIHKGEMTSDALISYSLAS